MSGNRFFSIYLCGSLSDFRTSLKLKNATFLTEMKIFKTTLVSST